MTETINKAQWRRRWQLHTDSWQILWRTADRVRPRPGGDRSSGITSGSGQPAPADNGDGRWSPSRGERQSEWSVHRRGPVPERCRHRRGRRPSATIRAVQWPPVRKRPDDRRHRERPLAVGGSGDDAVDGRPNFNRGRPFETSDTAEGTTKAVVEGEFDKQ